jgi:hypothetical protein
MSSCALMLFLCVLLTGASSFAGNTLTCTSPDREYVLELQNAGAKSRLLLLKEGHVLWRQPSGDFDQLSAAWAPDSREVLFVGNDRFSLNYLQIKRDAIRSASIDEKAFEKEGEDLIPYNWNAPNQGSIPHDLIMNIRALKEKGQFSGVLVRAKWPHKYEVKFIMTIFDKGGRVFSSSVLFWNPESIPW